MRISTRARLLIACALIILSIMALTLLVLSAFEGFLVDNARRKSLLLAQGAVTTIGRDIHGKVEQLQAHSEMGLWQEALFLSNRDFEGIEDIPRHLRLRDEQWQAWPEEHISPFMGRLITSTLSQALREEFIQFYEQKYGYPLFRELLLSNRYGAPVAMTGKTPQYRQDNKSWWRLVVDRGAWVSDARYDPNQGMYALWIGVKVRDKGSILWAWQGA